VTIPIAELLEPGEAEPLWPLLRQLGVRHAVSLLEAGEQRARWIRGESSQDVDRGVLSLPDPPYSWSLEALTRLKEGYAEAGFELTVIEDCPPIDRVRLGMPGREEQLDAFCDQIRAMGRLGIPTLCYSWIPIYSWARTGLAVPERGGSLTTEYDDAAMREAARRPEADLVHADDLWENFAYFLRRVLPVCEEAGVDLALHPDDPPISPVRGLDRIMTSVEAFERALTTVESARNGITLCQGNFALMTDDMPGTIRHLGSGGAIKFVHFRDVRGTPAHFVETWHDNGPTDMLECLRAYRDIGFAGVLRPDHVPTMHGEDNAKPGYAALGRLFAIGYIRGLEESVFGKPSAE
jgi:mannonate dehydratase